MFKDRLPLITEKIASGSIRIAPAPFDWDNDGNRDIVAGAMDGKLKVFINRGTNRRPSFVDYFLLKTGSTVFNAGSRSAPRMHDVNKDGLMDILVGEFSGHVYYLKNTGSTGNPVFKRADRLSLRNGMLLKYPGKGPRTRLAVTDWNNDGHDDILLGGADGRVMLFLTAQENPFSPVHVLTRTKTRAGETLIKIKTGLKLFLKSLRDAAWGRT